MTERPSPIDWTTREGHAIADLHHRIHTEVADGDGWNGGDLVDVVDRWFRDQGIDPDDPDALADADPSSLSGKPQDDGPRCTQCGCHSRPASPG